MIANRVVLPAPFGPTSATIWPSSANSDAWSSASSPPKRREMFLTCSSSVTRLLRLRREAGAQCREDPRDAARRERHHQHQHAAVDHQIEPRRLAGEKLGRLAE